MSNTAQPLPSPEPESNQPPQVSIVPPTTAATNNPPNMSIVPAPAAATTSPAKDAPAPEPKPERESPFFLNREQLDALSLTRLIGAAAQKRVLLLTPEGINAPFLTTLNADITATEEKSRHAANTTTSKKTCTVVGGTAKDTLVHRLRKVQSAARQKHLPESPHKLRDYGVGQRISKNRPTLEGSSQAIIKKADEERPPGVNTEFIVAANAERTSYVNAKPAQRGEQAQATTQRAERNTMVDSILARRKKIQYAADRVWPHTNPANAGVRGEFNLPLDRGYAY